MRPWRPGTRPWFGTKRPLPENTTDRGTAPQGGIIASASDLARYLMMMMNGQDDVLSAEGKALMMRPASDTSPFYGFGWFVDSGDGSVWHSGTSPGFESLATMLPTQKRGVVVLVNGGSGIGFGETAQLRNGITARALGLDYAGEGSRWPQKALFVALVLLPVAYLLSMVWAWRHRAQIRAKSGPFGLFSWWFPLLTTLAAAWVTLSLVPGLLGAPLGTIRLFQPDLGLALIATAVTGVLWAVVQARGCLHRSIRPTLTRQAYRPARIDARTACDNSSGMAGFTDEPRGTALYRRSCFALLAYGLSVLSSIGQVEQCEWCGAEGLTGGVGVEELLESGDLAVAEGDHVDEVGGVHAAGRLGSAFHGADDGDGVGEDPVQVQDGLRPTQAGEAAGLVPRCGEE